MSGISEPVTPKPISNTRILWIMAIGLIIITVGSLIFASLGFSVGLILGGFLAFANYYWLKISLQSIFADAVVGTNQIYLALKYLIRYFALGITVFAVYFVDKEASIGVICGLLSFAVAVLIEAIIRIFIKLKDI